jgi:hypothetical protein
MRRDMRHGKFCSYLRGPAKNIGGSSLSMILQYNETEAVNLHIQNTNHAEQAWVGTSVNNEFPEPYKGMLYSQIETALGNSTGLSPYGFLTYCASCKLTNESRTFVDSYIDRDGRWCQLHCE